MARDLNKLRLQLARQKGAPGIGAPISYTRDYYRALVKYSEEIAEILNETVIAAASEYNQAYGSIQDSVLDALTLAWQSFDRKIANLTGAKLALGVFEKSADGVDRFQRKKFLSNVKKAIGVDLGMLVTEPNTQRAIASAIDNNIGLIRSISGSYKERANRIIQNALTGGNDFTSLKKQLLDLGGFKEKFQGTEIRRAKTIARDQMQKLTSAINEARQTDAGVTHYYWDTANDERVRPSHAANDGERFAWASPPSTGHPGDDINCRCVARPDLRGLIDREGEL